MTLSLSSASQVLRRRHLARNVQRLDWLPLYRVVHDGEVVGLTYRLGGVWHAHVVDPSSTTVHHSREAAVESIRRGGWAE